MEMDSAGSYSSTLVSVLSDRVSCLCWWIDCGDLYLMNTIASMAVCHNDFQQETWYLWHICKTGGSCLPSSCVTKQNKYQKFVVHQLSEPVLVIYIAYGRKSVSVEAATTATTITTCTHQHLTSYVNKPGPLTTHTHIQHQIQPKQQQYYSSPYSCDGRKK